MSGPGLLSGESWGAGATAFLTLTSLYRAIDNHAGLTAFISLRARKLFMTDIL